MDRYQERFLSDECERISIQFCRGVMRGACAQNNYQLPVQQRPCIELLSRAVQLSAAVEKYSAERLRENAQGAFDHQTIVGLLIAVVFEEGIAGSAANNFGDGGRVPVR